MLRRGGLYVRLSRASSASFSIAHEDATHSTCEAQILSNRIRHHTSRPWKNTALDGASRTLSISVARASSASRPRRSSPCVLVGSVLVWCGRRCASSRVLPLRQWSHQLRNGRWLVWCTSNSRFDLLAAAGDGHECGAGLLHRRVRRKASVLVVCSREVDLFARVCVSWQPARKHLAPKPNRLVARHSGLAPLTCRRDVEP